MEDLQGSLVMEKSIWPAVACIVFAMEQPQR